MYSSLDASDWEEKEDREEDDLDLGVNLGFGKTCGFDSDILKE